MTPRRMLTALLAAALAVMTLVVPAPAQAHSSQIGSVPKAGAVLEAPPSEVVVEFDTPLLDIGAAVVVRTDDGTVVSTGAPRIERRSIAVAISPDAPDGAYTVAYRVVSQDGHTVESTFGFQVGPAAADSATASATQPAADPSASGPAGTSSVASASASPASPVTAAADSGDESTGSSTLVWILAGALLLVAIGVGVVVVRR